MNDATIISFRTSSEASGMTLRKGLLLARRFEIQGG